MKRPVRALVVAAAVVAPIAVSIPAASADSPGNASQFCNSLGAGPGTGFHGACVSFFTSGGQSDADAAAFCKMIVSEGAPVTVGQCVSFYNQYIKNG